MLLLTMLFMLLVRLVRMLLIMQLFKLLRLLLFMRLFKLLRLLLFMQLDRVCPPQYITPIRFGPLQPVTLFTVFILVSRPSENSQRDGVCSSVYSPLAA